MTRKRSAAAEHAWWSEPGPATCDFCMVRFHLEAGYHCSDCDRPICPICVLRVRERRTVICPQCHAGEEG